MQGSPEPVVPPSAEAGPGAGCLNCGRAFEAGARFCMQCGQRSDTARLSLVDMLRDLMNSPLHIERGPLRFVWALLTRPGRVARDFVDGRRRRYFGPFATLVTVVGLAALAVNASGYQVLANDGLGPSAAQLLQRHFNLLQLAHLPLQAAVCWVVFRSARLSWIEHMVLAAYTLSVRGALLVMVVLPQQLALSRHGPTTWETALFWALWYVYFGWACVQFYGGRRWRAFLGGVVSAMAEHAAIIGSITGAAALIAHWGPASA